MKTLVVSAAILAVISINFAGPGLVASKNVLQYAFYILWLVGIISFLQNFLMSAVT